MKKVIEEKWDKLIEKNFSKYIESIHRYYKLFILSRDDTIKY